ncbi:MAG TPA: peptidoglycan-binding domain-containing protein [Acidimicrobiales bacterium]
MSPATPPVGAGQADRAAGHATADRSDTAARAAPAIPPDAADPAMSPDAADPATPIPPGRRRRALVAGTLISALVVGAGVAGTRLAADDGDAASTAPTAADLGTATVERRTLEEHAELDGALGYGDQTEVTLAGSGTVTGLAPIGSVIDRGGTLVEVDGRPVPLLIGDRPLWRPLGPDVEDGPDVEQLEANLVALGVVTPDELTVDEDWTAATTDAVEEWQDGLGLDATGRIAVGDLVFLPGPVRVAAHPVPVGSPASGTVLEVTGTTQVVTVDLEATRQDLVEPAQAVEVVLPDGSETPGTVYAVGEVATVGGDDGGDGAADGGGGGGGDEATVPVVVALDDPDAAGGLDQAPVTVRVVTHAATDVLAVPVEALLATAEGGYVVEVVDRAGDGGSPAEPGDAGDPDHDDPDATELVPVELGAFADGWVEVTGDVAEGDEVVVPRG